MASLTYKDEGKGILFGQPSKTQQLNVWQIV